MATNYLKTLGTCSNPCASPLVVNTPGSKGDKGDPGINGSDGVNVYTILDADFVMPAVDGDVDVTVPTTEAFVAGLPVFVETAGSMRVIDVDPDGITMTLRNLGYDGNAVPTTDIIQGAKIIPQGEGGATGGSEVNLTSGSFNLPNGVSEYAVTGLAFGFLPSAIMLTIQRPVTGMNILALLVAGSITVDGFEVALSAPTDSTNYVISWMAIP